MERGNGPGIVVIGRNEGERLRGCLQSVQALGHRGVYVDSGSADGSVELARSLGFSVVELGNPPPYTAARARNAGLSLLLEGNPDLDFVQMVDGDCEVVPGWIDAAVEALSRNPDLAVVFGRRRERHPEASAYNMMCDDEWDVPVGRAQSCGGDAMFRVRALVQAGGYSEDLIAGEEPDLCLRMRRRNWTVERIPGEMTVHDVALHRFGQWWKRARRAGYAFAELGERNGWTADAFWPRQLASILFWTGLGVVALLAFAIGALIGNASALWTAAALALFLALQTTRLARKRVAGGMRSGQASTWAGLTMLGKFAQLQGMAHYAWARMRGRKSKLIEYKN